MPIWNVNPDDPDPNLSLNPNPNLDDDALAEDNMIMITKEHKGPKIYINYRKRERSFVNLIVDV